MNRRLHALSPVKLPVAGVVLRRLAVLTDAVTDFLDRYGTAHVMPPELVAELAPFRGRDRFHRFLEWVGHGDDAGGFFTALFASLDWEAQGHWGRVHIHSVKLPHELLMTVLEALEPGDGLFDVRSVEQLEDLLRRSVPSADRAGIQEVLDRFPVRLSQHSLRQMRLSGAVAAQYLPFIDELDGEGLVHTWVGQFHSGVIERMYRNRIIMILNMTCPVYCRFCFRKHKECRHEKPPTVADVRRGVDYVASHPEITEVVLTGGDPFMNRATLTTAVEGLLEVDHVRCLRLATRALSYHPALFTRRNGFWMKYVTRAQERAAQRGKRVEVATHFIHPDELSLRSLDLIAELVSSGVAVYVQTPLLGGINDAGPELVDLYHRLRGAGAEIHYVFMPCSPLQGNRIYRSTIDDGMRVAAHLRAHGSDRAMPRFCTATAIGKIDWGVNGWAVERDPDDARYLWLRTPYTPETFASFTDVDLSDVTRVNPEGCLDARFMVELGDDRWLRPNRARRSERAGSMNIDAGDSRQELVRFRHLERSWMRSAAHRTLRRTHVTRAEVELASLLTGLEDVRIALDRWKRVREVVLWSSATDPLFQPLELAAAIERLGEVSQIAAIRVRSRAAGESPQRIPREALQVMTSGNRLAAVAPLRIELELQVHHDSELSSHHGALVDGLRAKGVTTTNFACLLAGINASPNDMLRLSHRCREMGIEFCQLVVAGHPVQALWHASQVPTIDDVITISSELRRLGSGRELPRTVVQTGFGEIDLGHVAEPMGNDGLGHARLRILSHRLTAPGVLSPWGRLPEDAEVDDQGHPIVAMVGLRC